MINGPTNLSRSHNDTEMDALWAEFNAATDVPARAEIFSRIQGHTYEQAYFAKMGNVGQNYALSPKLEGFTSWPGPVRFWDVWLEP
jgi:ABC-type transport system substrate-binding protein